MTRYYLRHPDESVTGPHDALEIAEAIRSSALPANTPAAREGSDKWQSASLLCAQDGLEWKHWPTVPALPANTPQPPQPVAPAPALVIQRRGGGCLGGFMGGLTGCALLALLAVAFGVVFVQSCTKTLVRSLDHEPGAARTKANKSNSP